MARAGSPLFSDNRTPSVETDEQQLRAALRIARSAYWEYDVASDTFTFNQQFYSILRTTAEREGGYSMRSARYASRFVHPGDAAVVGAEIAKALSSPEPGYSQEIDHRIIFGDGEVGYFAVNIRVVKDAAGRTIKTYGVNVDVTARKRAKEELSRTVSLLQSTFDSTSEGLLVVDREGKIVSFNKRFVSLWGIPQQVLDARDDDRALAHVLSQLQDPEPFMRKVRDLYAHPEAESSDILDFKDGRVFERYSRPQLLEGVPIGRVWSFRDVTGRRELEAQLRQSQKMEAFGQLAAGVAHDFNNILTVIQGNASLLGTEQLGKQDERTARAEILLAAERAANLTRQLLTFSRRRRLQTKDVDLNEIVANMTKMLQRLIGEDIAQETQCAPGGSFVHADPGMMEQVLMNLAVNSRDAMPKGGRLSIQTAAVTVDAGRAQIHPKARSGEFVRLSVSDTGAGIPEGDLPHIFEPFFTTKEVGKGTGLGLATVYGIVEQHDGWIEVESRVNNGTTFNIYLARLPRKAVVLPESTAPSRALRGTETILLVEDEDAVRQLMQSLLERYGYRVYTAASGVRALQIWREHRDSIQILITDMVMPEGLGGRELAQELLATNPGLKVIYCSGYTNDVFGEDSPLRNNENFLEKPFQLNVLLQKIRDCSEPL
jgi:two-component system cell cycle sensor histidine kinase/response regulator CckA